MDEIKNDILELTHDVKNLSEKVMNLSSQVTVLNDRFAALGTIATDHEKRIRFLERSFFIATGGLFIIKMVLDAIK